MKYAITLGLIGILIFLSVPGAKAQNVETLFKAIAQLESSMKQLIADKAGQQEEQIHTLRSELAALKSKVATQEGAAPGAGEQYASLSAQVEMLAASQQEFDATQDDFNALVAQLEARIATASQPDTSAQFTIPEYHEMAQQLSTLVGVLKAYVEQIEDASEGPTAAVPAPAHSSGNQASAASASGLDKLKVNGYLRFRGSGHYNFDLDDQYGVDKNNDFVTVRSFVNLGIEEGPFNALLSLNLAGSEFDDGFFWGHDNPAQVRPWNASIQYLYLDYKGFVNARVGRMPAGFGNHIVAHTTRDGVKLAKAFNKVTLAAVWFKGGEGISSPTLGDASLDIVNDSTGSDHDLDALVVPVVWKYAPGGKAQFVFARLFDSRADRGFPEKMYFDLNTSGRLGRLSYAAEIALLRGQTPFNAARDKRLDYEAHMLFLQGKYAFDQFGLGAVFGLGSGDTDPTDDKVQTFQNLFMDETGYHYTTLFSDDLHGYTGNNSDLGRGSGFGNVTFYQLFGEAQPDERVRLFASATLMRATAARDVGAGIYGIHTADQTTRDIGHELDLGAEIQLTKASSFLFNGAVFFPGEIFPDRDTAYKLETGLAFRF